MFKDLIEKFKAAIAEVKNRCNEALKGLPPIDTVEAASEMAGAIRCMKSATNYLEYEARAIETRLGELETGAAARLEEMAVEKAKSLAEGLVTERLNKGELLSKADADAAAQNAAKTAREDVLKQVNTLSARRKELSTGKDGKAALLSAEVVAKIDDAVLLADDYLAQAGVIAERLGQLNKLGVKVESVLSEAVTLPTDEAGKATFKDRLSMIEGIGKEAAKQAGGRAPFASPPIGGGAEGDKSPSIPVFAI